MSCQSIMLLIFGSFLSLSLASVASAKGLDTLKPDPPAGQAEANQPAEETKKEVAAEVVRSAASKSIEDRLRIGTGLYFGTINGGDGDWAGRALGDLHASYVLPWSIRKDLALVALMRYAPTGFNVVINGRSARGIAAMYLLGAGARYGVREDLAVVAGLELGLVRIAAYSIDQLDVDPTVAGNGFQTTISGGADWTVLPKFAVGPRIHVGFGRLTTVHLGAATTFVF